MIRFSLKKRPARDLPETGAAERVSAINGGENVPTANSEQLPAVSPPLHPRPELRRVPPGLAEVLQTLPDEPNEQDYEEVPVSRFIAHLQKQHP